MISIEKKTKIQKKMKRKEKNINEIRPTPINRMQDLQVDLE